ncbi:MAG: 4Fe-4S ferredoxin [Desulfovibrionaceae bacterium]|nr:4Fe-4S ferredoxin [Desulfovibrionaceae bacterium]
MVVRIMRFHAATLACVLPAVLALLLGGAHLWRAGYEAAGIACALFAVLACGRQAWVRLVLLLILPLFAARWMFAAGQFVQLRILMEQPWGRLLCILGGVALFTAGAALLLFTQRAQQRLSQHEQTALPQAAVFLVLVLLFAVLHFAAPQLLLANRLAYGWGLMQAFVLGLWGAWLCGRLLRRDGAGKTRLWAWRLFSCIFFAQLVLGLAGYSLFLLNGTLHLPVPGLILAAPLYRGEGLFMPALFGLATLLAGSAWCSHLCYFGVWDAGFAACAQKYAQPTAQLVASLRRARLCMVGLMVALPLVLRLCGAPLPLAFACGLLLGLLMPFVAGTLSRRYGIAAYCSGLCPLGLVACWLGKLSPWRIQRTQQCIDCHACVRHCRAMALTPESLHQGGAGNKCTLCRDCLAACRHGGLTMSLWHSRLQGEGVERLFVCLIVVLHCLFLGTARV